MRMNKNIMYKCSLKRDTFVRLAHASHPLKN